MFSVRPLITAFVAASALTGCGSATRTREAPPAPVAAAAATPTIGVVEQRGASAAASLADSARHGYSAADVRFMQHMIGHHGQALMMTALVSDRTRSEAMRLLAERITVSQRDEMAMMRRWLEARHEEVPSEAMAMHSMPMHSMPMGDAGHAHDAGHDAGGDHALMPGMLTAAELATLSAATGPAFDRLFLQDMIRHHEGALTMVASLFGSTGAAQEPELFRLASDVDADQRAEIARMRALLATMSAQ